eukprot:1636420-Alexandrium_andersonii.AAC.1
MCIRDRAASARSTDSSYPWPLSPPPLWRLCLPLSSAPCDVTAPGSVRSRFAMRCAHARAHAHALVARIGTV